MMTMSMKKKKLKLKPNHPYMRKLIRERIQDWLLDFNASDPVVTVEGDIKVDLGLTRRQLEHLADFLATRIQEQRRDGRKSTSM